MITEPEQWKEIADWPGYYVSNKGNVVNRKGLIRTGDLCRNKKLREKHIPAIFRLSRGGASHKELGLIYGVSDQTIGDVLRLRNMEPS